GTVDLPASVDRVVTFTNGSSTGDCLVANIELAPGAHPAFSLPDGDVESRWLGQGASFPVRVRATPRGLSGPAPAEVTGALRYSAVALSPPAPVPLRARLAAGCLTLSPDTVAFGEAMLGCAPRVRALEVQNTCPGEVQVTALRTCPPSAPCPEFTAISSSLPPGGANLSPSATFSFGVRYLPVDAGSDVGAMSLDVVEGGRTVTYLAALSASAVERVERSESFTIAPPPARDVLIVINSQASMAAHAQNVRTNLAHLGLALRASGIEFHLAVARTAGGAVRGQFVSGAGYPSFITWATPDFDGAFAVAVAAATSGFENGGAGEVLATATAALTPPLSTSVNSGFLRPGAGLIVVVISDSPDTSPRPASDYGAALLGVKSGPLVEIDAITDLGLPGTCGTADDGRYGQLVSLTNGVMFSLCETAWENYISFGVPTLCWGLTRFYLSDAAAVWASSVTVEVDGTPVPAVDPGGSRNWSFDAGAASIEFEPLFVPGPRQVVTVRYLPHCE
ncbi:MAG: hypothetical protein ACYC8T_17415, partial [Myxococcaceae bacterium]